MIEAGAPDFWLLWYVGLVVATVRWVETVPVGIVVYQRTGVSGLDDDHAPSASDGPVRVFSRRACRTLDRGRTLLVVVLLMGGTSAVLALLGRTGQLEIWQLALASFINRCGWCTDNPVRRVMIGEVVGRERMSTAMSLDVGASNASRMVGPAAGGFLLEGTRIQGAFILSVLMYCTALWAIMTIRSRAKCRSATLTSLQVGEAFLLPTTGTNLSRRFGSGLLGAQDARLHKGALGPSASPFTLVLRQAWRRQANPHVP
jgi:MFS family permease